MTYTATYSPDDNKLRLYAVTRLDAETYARVKAAGFRWAPKQDLFFAPMWTPQREDLLLELAGEVGDEDTSLTERAEERAERFEEYQEKRADDAEQARAAVARIADNIPFGQPILVGHHSERHARKDAERIESGMRRAVKMWQTSQYWQDRAAGAIRHAKYKERADVRARRIKGLEADQRKQERTIKESEGFLTLWRKVDNPASLAKKDGTPSTFQERALYLANVSGSYGYGLWSDLHDGKITPEEAQTRAIAGLETTIGRATRWLDHYRNRLAYERAMMADAGGTVTDRTGPEKGGACRCWASPRGGWSYVVKVNKVSVSVLDNWGNGGENFTRTIEFDKLAAVMTAAEVRAKRDAGQIRETDDKTGFYLADAAPKPQPCICGSAAEASPEKGVCAACSGAVTPETRKQPAPEAGDFAAMAESLKAGVRVVTAPQLFPTPVDLARRMVDLADLQFNNRVLEPSAGTGNLVDAILRRAAASQGIELMAVERMHSLALDVSGRYQISCLCGDFLESNGDLGKFDRVVMNPPFSNGEDIQHITHALTFLRPGGRLVALCANGPKQQAQLQPLADSWEELPAGTFAGTNVRAVLLTINKAEL